MAHVIVINHVVQYLQIKFLIHDYLTLGILTCILVSVITPAIIKALSYIPFSSILTGVKQSKIEILNYSFEIKVWKNSEKGSKMVYKVVSYKIEG